LLKAEVLSLKPEEEVSLSIVRPDVTTAFAPTNASVFEKSA